VISYRDITYHQPTGHRPCAHRWEQTAHAGQFVCSACRTTVTRDRRGRMLTLSFPGYTEGAMK